MVVELLILMLARSLYIYICMYVWYAALGPLGLGPRPGHNHKTFLSPGPIVCPLHRPQARHADTDHEWTNRGLYLPRAAHDFSSSVMPWETSLPSNLLEARINSNAIDTISKEAYSLSRIIKLGPTHTNETRG